MTARLGFGGAAMRYRALQALHHGIMEQSGRWRLDIDVRKYYDSIDHVKLKGHSTLIRFCDDFLLVFEPA